MKTQTKRFKCPYENISCIHFNDVPCKECEHYNNGVRSTGSLISFPGLAKFWNKYKFLTKQLVVIAIGIILFFVVMYVMTIGSVFLKELITNIKQL